MSEAIEDTRQWCWRKPNSDRCEGPFASREEAIHDARHGHAEEGPIEVGRCTDPIDALVLPDADDMLELVEDALCDTGLDACVCVVDNLSWISTDEETVWPDDDEEEGPTDA